MKISTQTFLAIIEALEESCLLIDNDISCKPPKDRSWCDCSIYKAQMLLWGDCTSIDVDSKDGFIRID